MTAAKPIVNVADVPLKDNGNGEAFVAKVGRVGPMIGLERSAARWLPCRRESAPGRFIAIT